jgi:hypothetical protein
VCVCARARVCVCVCARVCVCVRACVMRLTWHSEFISILPRLVEKHVDEESRQGFHNVFVEQMWNHVSDATRLLNELVVVGGEGGTGGW